MSNVVELINAYTVRRHRERGRFMRDPSPDELRERLSRRHDEIARLDGGTPREAYRGSIDDLIVEPLDEAVGS
ncbi:MAG TPA: hypothetical protein VLA22_04330 [Gaiellaceae bacterium]|nr:hypothetical protein [Gaiellaceae bacterium]